MISLTSPYFWRLYRQLSSELREAARRAYRHFQMNPNHPGLHFHRQRTNDELWSARITKNHRAVGLVEGNTITWFWIGNHEEFDRAFPP
jgi:hypothetical protein